MKQSHLSTICKFFSYAGCERCQVFLRVPVAHEGEGEGREQGGVEVGEGLTKQNCKGQGGEGAIFVAALVATILNKVQDNRVTLLHSSQD